ncbi:MAG TPA: TetR/AcrR family transcriptional regulator [Acidobacteriota bacterium]|nr:TetR/AcrR family transcriptional regulator [Acidobacteriota bacterium]
MARDAKERILRTAYKLFASQGYDATSINTIVASSGTTKGALYHHYKAKEDLFFDVVQYAMHEHGIPVAPDVESFTKKQLLAYLVDMGQRLIKVHSTDHNFNNLFIELHIQARKNKRIGEWISTLKQQKMDFIRALVQRGVTLGAFRSADTHLLTTRIFFIAESIGIHMSATGGSDCVNSKIDFNKLWKATIEEMFV